MDNYSVDQALVLEGDDLVGTVTYDAVDRARQRAERENMEPEEVLTEDVMMEVEELNEEMREAIAKGLRDAERQFWGVGEARQHIA
ncbi:hypothetical protein [Haladaptatus sp. GCM10025893]|uniref:hypothetical protein n=1 Tax=Haladaptatus sp. GCM10025893 TaxID=3252659 RepID=UPI003611B32B